jgi:chemotaxis protein MotB
VLRKERFQGQTAALAAASFESLDSLAEVLKASPQIHIEIQVHSDNRGPEKAQIRSTQARAEAVRKHLTLKGVEKFRMVARGMGSQNPVASNRTPQGRLQNRRVEILRVE